MTQGGEAAPAVLKGLGKVAPIKSVPGPSAGVDQPRTIATIGNLAIQNPLDVKRNLGVIGGTPNPQASSIGMYGWNIPPAPFSGTPPGGGIVAPQSQTSQTSRTAVSPQEADLMVNDLVQQLAQNTIPRFVSTATLDIIADPNMVPILQAMGYQKTQYGYEIDPTAAAITNNAQTTLSDGFSYSTDLEAYSPLMQQAPAPSREQRATGSTSYYSSSGGGRSGFLGSGGRAISWRNSFV